jgi:hypothetical protein
VAKGARKTVALPTTNLPAPHANASGAPPANRSEAEVLPTDASQPASPLPAAMRGRWGLTPMDCTRGRKAPRGLLVIGPEVLRFFASSAVPTGDVQADAKSAAGTFHFAGQGQSWAKYEALEVQKNLLVRTESNPTASFTYVKCS